MLAWATQRGAQASLRVRSVRIPGDQIGERASECETEKEEERLAELTRTSRRACIVEWVRVQDGAQHLGRVHGEQRTHRRSRKQSERERSKRLLWMDRRDCAVRMQCIRLQQTTTRS